MICFTLLMMFNQIYHSTLLAAEAYSSPSIIMSHGKGDDRFMVDDYREADGSGRVIKRVQGQADCDALGDGLVFNDAPWALVDRFWNFHVFTKMAVWCQYVHA